jgi:hypothetical protein
MIVRIKGNAEVDLNIGDVVEYSTDDGTKEVTIIGIGNNTFAYTYDGISRDNLLGGFPHIRRDLKVPESIPDSTYFFTSYPSFIVRVIKRPAQAKPVKSDHPHPTGGFEFL